MALVTGPESARGRCRNCPATYDEELLDRLKLWRKAEASRRGVPAYVVFSDATLENVATELPLTEQALLAVPGIGARKLEDFGDSLIALVKGEPLPGDDESDSV
jgi:DNA helicase-2/ATP-dependent DNA helicase PcrA